MTPQDFIAKWGAPSGVPGPAYALNEEQGAQSHFLDLCELLGVPKPGSAADYRFEEKSAVIGGKTGYADVFMRGVFAWENKAPGKNLDTALKQLLTYSLALSNPPILVVSDRLSIRIHTQFTGHPSATHEVRIAEMDQPANLALLRRIWTAPESFKPRQTNRDITEAAAQSFAALAEGLRQRGSAPGEGATDPQHQQQRANQVAHFLTQCLFCFFAEDVGLLPGRMFERLLNNQQATPERLTQGLSQLFGTMQSGGLYGVDDIPWFNGGLFQTIAVPPLSAPDLAELRRAADLNWSAIDVSIFGTLFERGLDPAKRSQLGAHYTDPATIERLIGPVIRHPLLQKWELVAQQIQALAAKITKKGDKHYRAAHALFVTWLDELKNYRALDPACGSGNFLYLALKCLKDVEHHSHLQATELGLDREADLVTGPHNVLGIELNEYAAELARVTVWIGELQWRLAHHQRHSKAQRRHGGQRKAQRRFRGRITILRSKTRALTPKPEPRPIPDHRAQPPHRKKPLGPPPTWSSATRPSWATKKCAPSWATPTPRCCAKPTKAACPAAPTWCAIGSTRPARRWRQASCSAPDWSPPTRFAAAPTARCLMRFARKRASLRRGAMSRG